MRQQAGIGLVEMLVVLAITGIALGAAAMYLQPAEVPLETGANLLEGSFRQARLRAIATTSAFRVQPASSGVLATQSSTSCTGTTWTTETGLNVALPSGVTITDTTWAVCFSSRGVSTDNTTVTLQHPKYGTIDVEVLIGGTTRVIK